VSTGQRPLRRSQLIVPFGVGALVDFPGPVTLIHAGLDAWPGPGPESRTEFEIRDDRRLLRRLGVHLLYQPPDYRPRSHHGANRSDPNLEIRIPFLRFPLWHVCPSCGRMYRAALHHRAAPICEGPLSTGTRRGDSHRRTVTIQVRFVAACSRGHLQDFPWWEWALQGTELTRDGLRLRMHSTGTASLAGVTIICERDTDDGRIEVVARRSLAGAFSPLDSGDSSLSRLGITCSGHNPALAVPSSTRPAPGCGEVLHPVLKGSSSLYFPKVVSSIFIPVEERVLSDDLRTLLEDGTFRSRVLHLMEALDRESVSPLIESLIGEHLPRSRITASDVIDAIIDQGVIPSGVEIEPDDPGEVHYRYQEYRVLATPEPSSFGDDLLVRPRGIHEYDSSLRDLLSHVALLPKLRETRAFVGFSRLFPEDGLDHRERWNLISRKRLNWLPGVVVRGEGIFLVFNEDLISLWKEQGGSTLESRVLRLQSSLDRLRADRHQETVQITPRFVLLHTFSHLLINQLVYECGYGSASLRERIYSSDDPDAPMAGILIYTAAGDSEGTLGGLVRMGQPGRLESVVRKAIEKARWCSNDPVCIESLGQGPGNCNLAACHACALLPETSCEEQNRILDRGVIIGTLQDPELGFFSRGISEP